MESRTIFLLSPAHSGGRRAALLVRPEAEFDLAVRFREHGAQLGEVFSFLSGLYFRGKLAYASRFGTRAMVITPDRGLLPPDAIIGPGRLASFARTPVDVREPSYTVPLERDVRALAASLPGDARVVLLGSLATGKYLDVLARHLGERLHFPEPFLGMGDMQRGALMLRAVEAGRELPYASAVVALVARARPRIRTGR